MVYRMGVSIRYAIYLVTCCTLLNVGESKVVVRDRRGGGMPGSRSVDMRVEFSVEEGVPVGTFVGRIPTKAGFTYRFNEYLEYFMINSTSGEVRTRKEIDRESLQNGQFDIVVLSSQPTYPIEVRIFIKDVNDCSPTFPEAEVAVTFPESAIAGTRVFLDTAEDEDSPSNGVHTGYKIVDGNEDGHFRLVVTTNPSGEAPFLHLETTGKLNRETKPGYRLNISAQDDGIPPRFGYLGVNVSINDVNDCQPIFGQGKYYASLNESVQTGTAVLTVSATDADEGENARISYYLSETEEQFSIEAETGIIRTAMEPLNCPKNCASQGVIKSCPKSCVFTVYARDHGTPRQDGRTYVTVTLVESNHPPVIKFRYFPPTASTANVLESAQNASVVAAISVIDMDEGLNGETVVEIVEGNELKNFILESSATFQLVRTNGMLDREKVPFYNLTITARDSGDPPCSSTAFLIIEVNNDQDAEISFAKTEYSAVLRESVAIGSYVESITATGEIQQQQNNKKSSSQVIIYSIVSGNENQWFSIDGRTGLLTTRDHLDREQQGSVRLKISARDGGPYPKYAYAQIKITILDENDETPKFREEMVEVGLAEDVPVGTEVAVMNAVDHDQGTNGTITYLLSYQTEQAYPGQFMIDGSSGKITIRSGLDREEVGSYDIVVIAKDHGNPALSSSAVVHLEVKDVNDNAPTFYPLEYYFVLRMDGLEQQVVGSNSVVGQVMAKDLDAGINGKVMYKLVSANPVFEVDGKTGNILVKGTSSLKKGGSFQLQITAVDGAGKVSENDAMVNILVEKEGQGQGQELRFRFSQESYTFSLPEDFGVKRTGNGREVGRVVTLGENNNGEVKYTITNGDEHGDFSIDQKTGVIMSTKLLDREVKGNYSVTIFSQKGGGQYASCTVLINLTDLNDQIPTWDYSQSEVNIKKNAAIGEEIVVIRATDGDEGINAKLIYSLSSNPLGLFSINPSNGLLTLEKSLRNVNNMTEVVVEVMATDCGGENDKALFSKRSFLLHLIAVNQHSPVFEHFSYETSLLESTPVNTRFFVVKATDKDFGGGDISYEILEGNKDEKFGIFPDGTLFIKSHLDREEVDYFSLSIMAKDNNGRSSSTTFVIHVIDENDIAPKFSNATFTFSIPENEPGESYVGKVVAMDGDMGRNAELSFHFTGGGEGHQDFYIDGKTGFIKTLRPFDREQLVQGQGHSSITLEVSVEDNGVIRLKDRAQVIITITDVNDVTPKFGREVYNVQISEDSPIGAPVVRVVATDADEGLNGELLYSIVEGNEMDKFQIEGATGHISLKEGLDRESKGTYGLVVMVQDMGEEKVLRSRANVSVAVLDANDCAPQFQSEVVRMNDGILLNNKLELIETTPVNTELIQFNATDSDLGQNGQLSYSLTGGNRHDTFRIQPKTGILYLNKGLDYEKVTSYSLTITVTDFGRPRLSTSMELNIQVLDWNDCAPQFPSTSIVRQIQEGISLKSPIVTVTAEDADSGENGRIRYSIKHQSPKGNHFGIDASTGTIHTLMQIDREFADTFRLTIVGEDQAVPVERRLSSEKLVTVIVEDVNDCEPRFTCLNAALLRANSSAMSEIMVISATDLDSDSNGVVTYDVISGDTNLFELNRITGSLKVKRRVSSVQPRYQLTIRATDEAIQSQRKYADLLVLILGVSSEEESGGGGGVTFDKESYAGSISENEPVGSSILTVTATTSEKGGDGGGSDVEYYITNITSANDGRMQNRLFDVDVKRGIVSTGAILDREMGVGIFQVEIYATMVTARGLYTAKTQVKVTVLDLNDSPPVWPQSEGIDLTVSENAPVGQEIATLHATDEDITGKVSYSIVKGDEGKFLLDSKSGVLKIIDTLDREMQEEWKLVVRANDGEQSADTTVRIMVMDTNDNPPSWDKSAYSFDVEEDAAVGHVVGSLVAVDLDKGVNGRVTYSILSGWGDDIFSLNPNTGVFVLNGKLDYENVQHYIFVVQAQDTGVPSLSSTTTVYLNVMDLNDNSPVFEPITYSTEIPENIQIGSPIITVSASDMDSGDNGKIVYSITSVNVDDAFNVFQNGTIYTVKALDRETTASYQLTVQAEDQATLNPRRSSSVQVTITLKDVNDAAPEFISPDSIIVLENTPVNSVLVVVKAVDKDEGRNGYVEYALHNEKGTFSLGVVDGLLRVVGNIDREDKSNYTLRITARDRGDPPQSTNQELFIKVRDRNDHSPKFDSHQYSASVPENSSIGTNILQVSSFDLDEGLNSQIRYSIIAGDPNRDFNIGDDSGIVRVARALNFERSRAYTITVQAEDLGEEEGESQHHDTATVTITILDVNDRSPIFLDSPYVAYVRENMEDLPQSVLVVNAYDADSLSKNFQVRYLMKDGDKDAFRVNASTGEIMVHRVLDREKQAEYELTIVAMDTGTPRLTGTGMVQILVSDQNDCDPIFEHDHYELFVTENTPPGTFVSRVQASDRDEGLNAVVRYKIQSGTSVPFEVNQITGDISSKGDLDRETEEQYRFHIVATDSSTIFQRSSTAEVIVNLLDENDNFPKFKQGSYSTTIPNNIPSGSYVFGVTATDADVGLNGDIRYFLGGPDSDKFQLNETTGVIKAIPALLKSGKNNLVVEVRAVDSNPKEPLSSSVSIKIGLVNGNKFPKIRATRQDFSFLENVSNTVVTTLESEAANPKDHKFHRFQYFIGGGNLGNAFVVDRRSGQVRISPGGLDYETAQQYELWVEVSDEEAPEFRSAVPIHVSVKDINDNDPVFDKKHYNVGVLEEEYGPKLVTTVVAVDKDSGVNGAIRYFLSSESGKKYGKIFEVRPETGEIYSKVKLDREEHSAYVLKMEAVDLGDPPRTGTATVTVNVEDINDNPMKFTRLFSVNVTENAPLDTFVIQVTSVDKDVGENANCSYSFADTSGKFKIDLYSGNVTVSGHLDREVQDEYLLKVSAKDGSWRAETLLTITIEDVNDMAPEFEGASYNFNIPESESSVSFVGQVSAIDRDKRGPNSLVTYALKHQSDLFSVDPVSGEVFTKKAIKYKHPSKRFSPENEHGLVITAMDSGKPPLSSEVVVVVNVVNVNNHPPKFSKEDYFSPILFDMKIGSRVMQLKASDVNDFGLNAEVEYLKIGGNGSEIVDIDKTTGWIVLAGGVDKYLSKRFVVHVRAIDKGIPPLYNDALVVLAVTGVNHHTPIFSSLSYRVIVPENEVLGSVIVTLAASDKDDGPNGEIRYNISRGNEREKFSINPKTGAVSIVKDLDYDTLMEYTLQISATDLGYKALSSEAELIIILTDVNDNPPIFGEKVYAAEVKENAPLRSKVFTLTAVDKDSPKNAVIRYAIVGGSGKHAFSVDPVTGIIISTQVFDYEDINEYVLDIMATNPDSNLHSHYSTCKVVVGVVGVNEYVPRFVQPVFHFSVSESASVGTFVGSLQATDEDSGDDGVVYYILVGSSNDRGFMVDSISGEITVSRRLDRESQARVVLSALAKNKGSIRGNDTDEAQIVISVQDGNDPPVFEKEEYVVEIGEDVEVGREVVTVVAVDRDVRPANNRFTYQILSEGVNDTFRIDHITGVISTAKKLDREEVASWVVVVGAIDTGTPPAIGKSTVTINLRDINDNAPTLKNSSRVGEILENEPSNTKVMTLQAIDADMSPNGEPFSYSLVSGKGDASKFRVDSTSGNVYSLASFDRETMPEFTITVEISDNGKPRLKSRQEVKIKVGDKNDNLSQPRNAEILIFMRYKIPHLEKVASVKPLDADTVGDYSCRLQTGNDYFAIQKQCDLLVTKFPTNKRQSITIVGDDGKHAEVVSLMQTEFVYIEDVIVKNSVIIRAKGIQPEEFLAKSYIRFVSWLNSMFQSNAVVYNLMAVENGTNIVLAIPTSGNNNGYMGVTEFVRELNSRRGEIEHILGGSGVIINYSPCEKEAICQNGGSCARAITMSSEQVTVESEHFILSAPKLVVESSCECSPEFTGVNCQHRKEPCSPNPCQDGGMCIRQGFDFSCVCPPHKQGKRCEAEKSNVCKGNPCLNGGTCKENQHSGSYFCLCRPGFLGDLCQTASNVCKPNPCLNGGECSSPLGGTSAFPKCKCRAHYFGRYCEKSAFGFGSGSFMTFQPLDPNTNDIAITFSTNKRNSLLAYDFGEQTGGRSDFVALQLIEGKPVLSYGGARTEISSIPVNKFVADGNWWRIIATRNSRVVSLYVSLCQQGGEICEECKPGNPSCYASGHGKSGTLNFNSLPLLIGGVKDIESVLERPGQIQTDDFVGCIHSIAVNGRFLNMSTPLESRGISEECHRGENVCGGFGKCGGGQCIDLWDSNVCNCNGVIASNCQESFLPYSFSTGSYVEYKVGERYKRSQILPQFSSSSSKGRKTREIMVAKSVALSFRTIQMEGVLFYAGSEQDYTLVELDQGGLQFSSRLGSNRPIRMKTPGTFVSDGMWHTFRLTWQNRGVVQLYLDGVPVGEELDAASAHDFLDPYLTVLVLGGTLDNTATNSVHNGFTGCMTNFTINNENQPMNGSSGIFDYIITHGKLTRGCNSAIAGAATAPDPLSIGVTLIIVFFVFLLVGISGSVVVFRLRKREKNPLPNSKAATKPSPGGPNPGDVVRSHLLDEESEALRNFVRNSKKMVGNNTCYQKPDIIERTTLSTPQMHSNNSPPHHSSFLNSAHEISMEPEMPDLPEHYDLENASSIAPSDIDIVYHYKGFRDNLGGRKSSPFRHNHHGFSANRSGGIRQSPISNVLKSTPLARLSPSSELSQQITPRILTLQDISGKPLQSALLATTHQKESMSQSERSLNISRSSSRSSIVNGGGPSGSKMKKRKKCGGGGDSSSTGMNIGLTAEEIERLNNSRHKNNSSLISTLDDLSSESEDHRRKGNNLSNLLERKSDHHQSHHHRRQQQHGHLHHQRSRDTSSDEEDESGNDSFSCSEFDYDNDDHHHHNNHHRINHPRMYTGGSGGNNNHNSNIGGGGGGDDEDGDEEGGSFHGSLSTLVASDDDLAYINTFASSKSSHLPPGGPSSSSMRWDYLLNWGPNFDNLSGVFNDIAQLPDVTPPIPGTSNNSNCNNNLPVPTSINNFGNSGPIISHRNNNGRVRPSEEYI